MHREGRQRQTVLSGAAKSQVVVRVETYVLFESEIIPGIFGDAGAHQTSAFDLGRGAGSQFRVIPVSTVCIELDEIEVIVGLRSSSVLTESRVGRRQQYAERCQCQNRKRPICSHVYHLSYSLTFVETA